MSSALREARIILVQNDLRLDGTLIAIAAAFGGFTSYSAQGGWTDPKDNSFKREEVLIVDIAYEQNTETDMKLFEIAMKYREDAKQQEVYLRYGNGHVQMVDIHSIMDNGRPNCWYSPDFGGATEAINTMIDDSQTEATRLEAFKYLVGVMADIPSGLAWE